jgi:hypothetical protein
MYLRVTVSLAASLVVPGAIALALAAAYLLAGGVLERQQ